MHRLVHSIVIPLALYFSTVPCIAQQVLNSNSTGIPPFGSFVGSDFDIVSMQNGNLHISIPILSVPQRGGKNFDYRYIYDIATWQAVWFSQPLSQNKDAGFYRILPSPPGSEVVGWRLTYPTKWSYSHSTQTGNCDNGTTFTYAGGWFVIDPEGTKHPLPFITAPSGMANPPACGTPTYAGPALDGSGIYCSLTMGCILKDGSSPSEDANGNIAGSTSDTLQRSLLTFTGFCSDTWTYKDSTGNSQIWRIDCATYNVQTNFCGLIPHGPDPGGSVPSGCAEYSTSASLPIKLTLPDQTTYQFTWLDNSVFELLSIQLPTGATISYTYGNLNESEKNPGRFPNYNIRKTVGTRTVTFGTQSSQWFYSTNSFGVTVKNPDQSSETHFLGQIGGSFYSPPVEQGVTYYDASGKVLRTIGKTWTGEPGPDNALDNIREIKETTTLDNGLVKEVDTDYETFQYTQGSCACTGGPWVGGTFTATRLNPTEKREYDYSTSAPGPLLRRTDYTYLHNNNSTYANLNIVDRQATVITHDGSGNTSAQTTYEYDNYNHAGLPAMGSTGAVSHDSARGTSYTTRGNRTGVSNWLNTSSSWITTNIQYDDAGNIIARMDARGNVTNFDYTDSWNNATCAPNGQGKAYLTTLTNALGQISKFTYNSCTGSRASSKDQNDINASRSGTTYSYDLLGRTTLIGYPDGGSTTNCYTDVGGSLCPISGPPFQTVTSRAAGPDPNIVTTTVYDGLGRITQTQVNSNPPVFTDTTYDALGRVYSVSNPHFSTSSPTDGTTTYIYDALGRTCVVVPPDGTAVSGNACPATQPTNDVFTVYAGNSTTVTDQAGKSRTSLSDALGRLTQVTEDPGSSPHLSYATAYTYDALNNLMSVVQNGSHQRSFAYDSLSRLSSATNPESGTITYTYDANGNLLTKTSPAQNQTGTVTATTTHSYDALNRLTQKSYSGGTIATPTVTYTYDLSTVDGFTLTNTAGRLVKAATGGSTPTANYYSYDPMGRVTNEGQCAFLNNCGTSQPTLWVVNSVYDLAGNLRTYTDANNNVFTQTFDGAGRPTQLSSSWSDATHPANLIAVDATAGYTPWGAIKKAQYGNGLTETLAFNSRLQPCRMNWNSSGTALSQCSDAIPGSNALDFTLGYSLGASDNGNVVSWNAVGQQAFTRSFAYDSLNRISTMTETGGTVESCKPASSPSAPYTVSWSYDAWGNRTSQSPSQGTCLSAQPVNANNQLTSQYYDAAGNQTTDALHSYIFDAENRIASVDSGNTATYLYDAGGRRVAKATPAGKTFYVYGADGQVVSERDTQGNWAQTYIHFGPELVAIYRGSSTGFLHKDHLGSTRLVTLSDQSVYDNMDYLPFGEQLAGGSGTTHKFTGKERDSESNLDDFDARYYSSALGRFTSPDWSDAPVPVPYADLSNPQTLNLYGYVKNNPLRDTDPTGHSGDDDSISKIIQDAVLTAIGTWASDNLFGALRPNPDTLGGKMGQAIGDFAAQQSGIAEAETGATLTPGALALAGAGQPEALAVPAVLDVHGTATAAIATVHLAKDAGETSSGGGRNEQKSNLDRQKSANERLEAAKAERDALKSKPNKTPEDKAKLEKLNNQVKHLQKKASEKSETHSRKQKGQQQ